MSEVWPICVPTRGCFACRLPTESTWGKVNDSITYFYDANGSLEYKFYGDVDIDGSPENIITNNPTLEYDYYEYNLQGRLSALTKSRYVDPDTVEYVTEYVYSPQGARVRKIDYESQETTVYLQDLYNHTGYAQVLEEITFDSVDVDPLTDTPTGRITYTIGDDIISQTNENGVNKYLIYDGHGSTRQLQNSDETIGESYNYDAYGIMLQSGTVNPAATTPVQGTSLLYAGEQFDFDNQHYYNRARWYNPYNGRFNRIDSFAGNNQDPQSLHKYLYAHCNPINGIDPSGETLVSTLKNVSFCLMIRAMELAPTLAAYAWATTKIAGIAFLASTITRWLEVEGWIPESGITEKIQMASGAIFFAGFIFTGLLQSVPQVRGRVPYGSTNLSRQVKAVRQGNRIFGARNGAVFEYRANDGRLRTIIRFSKSFTPGGGHAERIIGRELDMMGVKPSQVTRIYSELEPCGNLPGGFCKRFLQENYPQSPVSWSFEYGDYESRRRGLEGLQQEISKLW